MHRSGTSLVAAWLERCGLPIHAGCFIQGSLGNPKGHFEDADFVSLHSSATLRQVPDSWGWKVLSGGSVELSSEDELRARSLIRHRNTKYAVWGWKDPRTILYLADWKRILPGLKVFCVWRPCSDVVASLVRRSRHSDNEMVKITAPQALRLWLSYNSRLRQYAQDHPAGTLLLHIEDVVRRDREVIGVLNDRFGTRISFRPIHNVYDESLWRGASNSLWKCVRIHPAVRCLERTLRDLSELSSR